MYAAGESAIFGAFVAACLEAATIFEFLNVRFYDDGDASWDHVEKSEALWTC